MYNILFVSAISFVRFSRTNTVAALGIPAVGYGTHVPLRSRIPAVGCITYYRLAWSQCRAHASPPPFHNSQ
jgi:hypothetical protein